MAKSDPAKGDQPDNAELKKIVGAAVFCRLFLNTSRRFIYPFAPALSRGLDVPVIAVSTIAAVNQSSGILGFVFGPLTDRIGYRIMMITGLILLTMGMFLAGILPFYTVILVAVFLSGTGKIVFDMALQAYTGKMVPFHRRGRIIGILEVSWAGSTLVGIPLIGLLIDRWGWRSPFFLLAGAGLVGFVFMRSLLPPAKSGQTSGKYSRLRDNWKLLFREKPALGALAYSFFSAAANDNLFVVYGFWLEQKFGMSITAIGISTAIIGFAELTGESLVATLSDRIGIVRAITFGALFSAFAYAFLIVTPSHLVFALSGLFFVFTFYEFTTVSFMSLCTEILPDARATMMSGFHAFAGLGRVAGAIIGGVLWQAGGIVSTCLVSSTFAVVALVLLRKGLFSKKKSS